MWYMPYLRVRRAVLVYGFIAIGISLAAIALRFLPAAVHLNGHEPIMRIDVSVLLVSSAALVGGLATVLGLNLAAENEGHLEVAWTKPVSREGYALGVFAVDIGAMVVCIALTLLCQILVFDVYARHQAVTFDRGELFSSLAYCGLPLCVYAWVTALSASLKRNRGAVAGLFWPVMIAVIALRFLPVPAAASVASALSFVDPLAIYTTNSSVPASPWMFAWGWAVAAILLASALVQWRRLEL